MITSANASSTDRAPTDANPRATASASLQDVHVVAEDDAFRNELIGLLTGGGLTVKADRSVEAFCASVPSDKIGCVVLDLVTAESVGLDHLSFIMQQDPSLHVIVLNAGANVPLAVRAMKIGAFDFLQKPMEREKLLRSVRQALDLDRKSLRRAETGKPETALAALTSREADVLHLVVDGHSNKMIAYKLGISPRTVEVHRASAKRKLNASNLAELVRIVLLKQALPA